MPHPGLIAIIQLALQRLDNDTLAELNIAISGDGKVLGAKHRRAYLPALRLDLIDYDGKPRDKEELLDALASEIKARIATGDWL